MTSVTCPDCGFGYVPSIEDNVAEHQKVHTEYAQGPFLPAILKTRAIAEQGEYHLHIIDCAVPLDERARMAYVALVAHRAMNGFPAGYDGTVSDLDERMYVLMHSQRAVGMVLTSLEDDWFWCLGWGDGGRLIQKMPSPVRRRGPKVARIWLAANYQTRGLARWMIQRVAAHLSVEPAALGWELPITKKGRKFLHAILPDQIWGCGDRFSLDEALAEI